MKKAAEGIETLSCSLGNDEERMIAKPIKMQNKGVLAIRFLLSRESDKNKRLDGEAEDDGLSMEI